MGEGMVGHVVDIPREANIGEGALQYINGKLGFIVYRVLIKCFALIEECAILWVEWHEWIADVEGVFCLQKAPFHRQFGKEAVVDK